MDVIVLDKPSHKCFDDLSFTVKAIEGDATVCFGVQDWTLEELATVFANIHNKKICYQLEVLDGKTYYSNNEYIRNLSLFDEVWDYSLHNLKFLQSRGINPIYVPVLPSKLLKNTSKIQKNISILHVGMLNNHRVEYLNYAIKCGINVFDLHTVYKRDIWGDELHELFCRSEVLLGLHSFPDMPIQEAVRYQYPLSNDVYILAEKSLTNPLNLDEFGSKEEMVLKLKKLINYQDEVLEDDILVSVIMPVYNAELQVSDAINSLLAQTYKKWELIAVDDGSEDNSLSILIEFKNKDNRINVFSKENEGPAKARAFGMKKATGDYFIYLDSDDAYSSDLLEKCISALKKNRVDAACPNLIQQDKTKVFKDNFLENHIIANGVISGQKAFELSINWQGVHSLIMCRADIFIKVACDNENLYGNFNSDELIARKLFLNINELAFCSGEYIYNYNTESVTKTVSAKLFGYLETNTKLIHLAKEYNQKRSIVGKIETNSFREMIDLYYLFNENKDRFTPNEKRSILCQFKNFYNHLDKKNIVKMLNNRGFTQKMQKYILLNNFYLCKLSLRIIFESRKFSNKLHNYLKNKFYPYFGDELLSILDN